MKRSVLMTLVFAIVLVVSFASYLTTKDTAISEFQQKPLLSLQGAEIDLNEVTKIALYGQNNQLIVEADKVFQQWILPQHQSYMANETLLSELLVSLKNSEIVEAKTKLKKYHSRLGLTDVDSADSDAKLLIVGQGKTAFAVILGITAANGTGQFVRLKGDDQTYLIDQTLNLPQSSSDWIREQIIAVEYDKIRSVKVTPAGEAPFQLLRLADEEKDTDEANVLPLAKDNPIALAPHFEFADQDSDQTLAYPGILDGLVRNILGLTAQDVVDAAQTQIQETLVTMEIVYHGQDNALLYSELNLVTLDGEQGYFVNDNTNQFWLKISDFDFKQVNQSKDAFFEQGAE